MKKVLFLAAAAVSLSTLAIAQDKKMDKESASISVGVEAALPIGNLGKSPSQVKFSDYYKFGIGGSIKGALPIFTGGAVTLSAGYISFSGKSTTILGQTYKNPALNLIPLKVGLRYAIA